MKSGAVPEVLARAWLAEALDARWRAAKDVIAQYEGSESVDSATILVPLDGAGHCVVFLIEFRMGLVVIQFAGHKRGYAMPKRRTGAKS